MKKILKLVLASLMILAGATACSKNTEGTYTPGEYTGEAQGFVCKVSVTSVILDSST